MTASLSPQHREMLRAAAIPDDVALAAGVRSIRTRDELPESLRWCRQVPGALFLHHCLDGDPVPQYRPDESAPDDQGRIRKYLFPVGAKVSLSVVPAMRPRISTADRVLIVEGTKQTLTAVANVPDDVIVVGVAGCWGWSEDGIPSPDLGRIGVDGRPVLIAFDADHETNPNVYGAASRITEHLEVLGAESVRFVSLPASGSTGLDDYLGTVPDPAGALARLLDRAGKLGRRPKVHDPDDIGARFFDANGLRVIDVAAEIRAEGHYAVGPDGAIWGYQHGVYVDDNPVVGAVRKLLGNRFREQHLRNATTVLADILRSDGRVLGVEPGRLINVCNGMLDVTTGRLTGHDPKHLSMMQLSVEWQPGATCPTFDTWLPDRCGNQAPDLLEATGLMLCPWIPQRKVPFLFGPTRTGKSTLLRLLEAIAVPHVAAVTLHQLGSNRFAAAALYGKLLNVAGDLSDHHIDDLSLFKQVTGDDTIAGERKFRDPFVFRNRALFLFSANTPPTVSESSRAYLARVRPYVFPRTLEGHEDAGIETKMMAELPGILVRLVEGARRWITRGGYGPANPLVEDEFAQQSDVAALFAAQVVAADPGGFVSGRAVFDAYSEWAVQNGRGRLGRNKFLARVESTLGTRVRADRTGPTGWRDMRLLSPDEWNEPDPSARFAFFSFTSLHEEPDPPETEGDGDVPREGEVGPERAKRAHQIAPIATVADPGFEDF